MPLRLSERIQRSAAVLLVAASAVWLLNGCAVATLPVDVGDLPLYARDAPSDMMASR